MSTNDPEAARTVGLRVLPGSSDLAARVSLDFAEHLFRRSYRWPVLVSAALAADAGEIDRWLTAGAARLLGRDLAARVLNRTAAEGAEPLFLHAVASGGSPQTLGEVRAGFADACTEADCALLCAPEVGTYDRRLAIAASATAVVDRSRMTEPARLEPGDVVLAVGSNRAWPEQVDALRGVAAKPQVAKALAELGIAPHQAHVQPAPVLAGHLQSVLRRYSVKRVVHRMTPVEADGLAAARQRLTAGAPLEIKPNRSRRAFGPQAEVLRRHRILPAETDEAHRRGIGMLMAVGETFAASIARRLTRLGAPTAPYGRLVARGS